MKVDLTSGGFVSEGGKVDLSAGKFVGQPENKVDNGKPIIPAFISDYETRVREFGGIKAGDKQIYIGDKFSISKKPWYEYALDFGKAITPYSNLMTEEGRMLHDALPEGARSDENFSEFTKLLDWMIGGERAISFIGKKFMDKSVKASDDAFKAIVKKEVGMPLLKPKSNLGQTYHPPPLKNVLEDTVIESVAREITKPELEKIVKKQGIRNRISELRRTEKPLKSLVEVEQELAKKAEYEATKKGQPLLKPKSTLGQKYHPESIENILETINNQRGWVELDVGAARKAIKENVKKWYDVPISEKDMSAWDQAVMLPHWLVKKYPKLKNLYGIERKRGDARAEFAHMLLDNSDDFFRLKGKDLKATEKLLIVGDTKNKVFSTEELLKAGFNDKVIRGYNSVRNTLDSVRDDYWKRMAENGIPEDEIMKLRQELGNIEGYFPRVRYGKYFVKAEKDGATPVRAHSNNPFQHAKLKRELTESGYDIIDEGKNTKLSEEVYFQVSPEAVSAVYERASRNLDDVTRTELKRAISETFKERGWLGHGINRQQFWEGFETANLKKVMFDYINGYAGFTTKIDAAKQYGKELSELAFPKEGVSLPKNQYEWATKYVRDTMSNADSYDKISQNLRSAMFFKYLGGVAKSGVVNLTQNFIAAGPRLSLETPFAMAKLNKAMVDIVGHYAGKKLKGHETRALRIALQKGWGQDQYMQELMGTLSKFGGPIGQVKKVAGLPMAIAEKFNRQSTFLAAYRAILKKSLKTMKPEEAVEHAIKRAGRVVEDSHFVYGKSNLPGALRGSPAGKLARSAYTFRTFTHNYISLLSHLSGQGAKGKLAVAKSLAAIGTIGGVSSLPLFKTAEKIAQSRGYNPRGYVRQKVEETFGKNAGDVALYGVPTAVGIDIGGSIGIEAIGQRAINANTFPEIAGEVALDVLGVPGSLFEDTYNSVQELHRGDIRRAIEESPVTPTVMSNAMKAQREYTEGTTTPKGALIESEEGGIQKLTKSEAIKRGVLGFQPVSKTEGYRKFQARSSEVKRWDKKAKDIKSNFLKIGLRYGLDSKQIDKVWERINDFNENKPVEISLIDPSTWVDDLYGREKDWKQLLLEERIK